MRIIAHYYADIIEVQEICRDPAFLAESNDFSFDITEQRLVSSQLNKSSDIPTTTNEAVSIPPEISKRIDAIEKSAMTKSSKEQMKRYSNKFISFLSDKGFSTGLTNISPDELSQLLRYFYSELKTANKTLYSPATLVCIRAALHRYFTSELSLKVNIMEDREFIGPNNVLKGMMKQFMEQGGGTKQFEAIEENDLLKIRVYFDRSSPTKLQEEVYFTIEYFLGTRGREWLRYLRKESICIKEDSKGKESIDVCNIHNIQKNVQPDLKKSKRENVKKARIYSTEDKNRCPVEAIKMLLSKLPPESEFLFYKANTHFQKTGVWYNLKQPLGVNTVSKFMSRISANAQLSKTYTPHCIRPTVVTTMWNSGFSVQDIQNVTGHKKEDSVKRYLKRVGDGKKEEYSRVLSQSFNHSVVAREDEVATNNKIRKFDDGQGVFNKCQFNNCTINIH